MGGRFKSPVIPGERLDVHIWNEGDQVLFQTRVGDRGLRQRRLRPPLIRRCS